MVGEDTELASLKNEIAALRAEVLGLKRSFFSRVVLLLAGSLVAGVFFTSAQTKAREANVEAPFTIVDTRGAKIFTVDDSHNIKIYDAGGEQRVGITLQQDGPSVLFTGKDGLALLQSDEFEVISKNTGETASIGYSTGTKTLALRFLKGDKTAAAVGIGASGLGAMSVRDSAGKPGVTIGSTDTGGYVDVFNSVTTVAEMSSGDGGKGKVAVYNSSGKPVAFLTESTSGGGGNVTIADPAGNGIVSAGYSAADQGDICLDRKNHLYCVGVNLPLSISH